MTSRSTPGFPIASVQAGGGTVGLCPLPGRSGSYDHDMAAVRAWAPALVVTMVTAAELEACAPGLPGNLARAGIAWAHLPVADYGTPAPEVAARWPAVSEQSRAVLARGARVLVHCAGGCGRSGMATLRLLVDLGEAPDAALARLRAARPCAVETEGQRLWASSADGGQ
jgi:hypothetical protein